MSGFICDMKLFSKATNFMNDADDLCKKLNNSLTDVSSTPMPLDCSGLCLYESEVKNAFDNLSKAVKFVPEYHQKLMQTNSALKKLNSIGDLSSESFNNLRDSIFNYVLKIKLNSEDLYKYLGGAFLYNNATSMLFVSETLQTLLNNKKSLNDFQRKVTYFESSSFGLELHLGRTVEDIGYDKFCDIISKISKNVDYSGAPKWLKQIPIEQLKKYRDDVDAMYGSDSRWLNSDYKKILKEIVPNVSDSEIDNFIKNHIGFTSRMRNNYVGVYSPSSDTVKVKKQYRPNYEKQVFIHEAMHYFSSAKRGNFSIKNNSYPPFLLKLNGTGFHQNESLRGFNEACTERMTSNYCKDYRRIVLGSSGYREISKLLNNTLKSTKKWGKNAIDDKFLKKAYFTGDLTAVEKRMDAVMGKGFFKKEFIPTFQKLHDNSRDSASYKASSKMLKKIQIRTRQID